ncbi:malonate utilization transcriptional regulator [Klebsiella michiganensis]|nr:malonate utilization transcriptional regulator [Klebsiella michiganensis]
MKDDINQDITFRKLSVFMMFMAKGNIARTAEAMQLSGRQRPPGAAYAGRGRRLPAVYS